MAAGMADFQAGECSLMDSDERYRRLFRTALTIRLDEERIIELYPSDRIQSPVHLSIGQEAVAVGVCDALNVDDLVSGAYGASGEGWFDGYGLVQALRKKAQALGARYVAADVTGVVRDGRKITHVVTNDGERHACDTLVNAAGAWTRTLSSMMGIDIPVYARRRSIFNVSSPAKLADCPLLIDPTGVYFRPEGRTYICGTSPSPDRDPDDLPLDEVDHDLFDEVIWPTLANRVPEFEALRVENCWSGYYEYNVFDHNAIIGYHPELDNVVFANGYSGHGLQQGPATGRGVSELILGGRYETLDLSSLGWERVLENRPIVEKNVV